MMGLESMGLVEDARAGAVGVRKAWRVTPRGRAALGMGWLPRSQDRPQDRPQGGVLGLGLPADFRLTVRTQMVLVAVAEGSARGAYLSNLQVARRIGISAKGTVSRMMSRLQDQGLVENTRGRDTKGVEKAWRLTPHGQAVLDAHRPAPTINTDQLPQLSGGKLVAKRARQTTTPPDQQKTASRSRSDGPARETAASSGRREASRSRSDGPARPAWRASHASDRGRRPIVRDRPAPPIAGLSAGFRLTVRTHLVLSAIAEHTGASSRKIAQAAGVNDEGQISKLLRRLQDRDLIHNTAHTGRGKPKAWRLTPQGETLLHQNHTHSQAA